MRKHLDIKTYEYFDIKIMVEINYELKLISLVESGMNLDESRNGPVMKPKSYVFVGRGLEYMNGWLNVLDAMKYAIEQAKEELETYLAQQEKEKHDTTTEILLQATNLVNQKRYAKKKKA